MLTDEEVKPLLVREDHPVRDSAINYFRGTRSQDVQFVPFLLQAYRRYGTEESRLASKSNNIINFDFAEHALMAYERAVGLASLASIQPVE